MGLRPTFPPLGLKQKARRLRLSFVITLVGTILATAGGIYVATSSATADSPVDPFTSSWDLPLSANAAVLSGSASMVANLVKQYEDNYGTVAVNGGIWNRYASGIASGDGLAIVTVPAGQPVVHVRVGSDSSGGSCDDFTSTTAGGGTGSEVPIPPSASALVSGKGDSPLLLYQPSTDTEWEFWEAEYSASAGWTACNGGELTNLSTSSGTFPGADGFGLAGSGISYLGTAITEADVQSGSIDHAIAMDANVNDCNGYVAPATRGDCPYSPGQVSEGSFLRFPTSLAMPSGLTPFAQMVFKAVQSYGAVITDQSGGVSIQAENGYDWTYEGHSGTDPITASWDGNAEDAALGGMPWSKLEVVAPTRSATTSPSGVPSLALPNGAVHEHYSWDLASSKTYRWKVGMGALPAGLHLAPNGVIHGVPKTSGSSIVVIAMREHRQTVGVEVITIHIT